MSKIKIISILSLAVLVIFSVSSVNAATDKVQSVSKTNEFKQNLKNLDTTNPVTKEIKKTGTKTYELPQANGNSVQVDENTKAIKIKFNGKEFKITDKDTKALTNELVSGSLVRKNSNGDVASSVEAVDGGLRMVLNIEKTTDKFYTYDFPVEAETGTKYVMNGQGAKLVASDDKTIVSVIAPWASDSNKKSLKTWYTVENNGSVLRQHVDLSGAKFPVLADPTWCGWGIQSVTWKPGYSSSETRDTLSIIPTWCGRYVLDPASDWAEVTARFPWEVTQAAYSVGWWNTNYAYSSMFLQFSCHYSGTYIPGKYKNDWNLEPWRPIVSVLTYINTSCNPK